MYSMEMNVACGSSFTTISAKVSQFFKRVSDTITLAVVRNEGKSPGVKKKKRERGDNEVMRFELEIRETPL